MKSPIIPRSRKKPASDSSVAEANAGRLIRPRTSPESVNEPSTTESLTSRTQTMSDDTSVTQGHSTRHSIRRYARVVRQTAWRLTNTVREATADGSMGSAEISRLHVWVTADLVPWAVESVELVDETAKRQAMGLIAEVKRLDAELSASIGTPAADIADQLRRTGSAIVSILVKDD